MLRWPMLTAEPAHARLHASVGVTWRHVRATAKLPAHARVHAAVGLTWRGVVATAGSNKRLHAPVGSD